MRQKTGFSVIENDIKKHVIASENEGPDLGIPWPDGPPSSDCPMGWHTDDAPWEGRVRDRPSLERPGSRPVLAQNQGVSPRASRRGFLRPLKLVPGFFGG